MSTIHLTAHHKSGKRFLAVGQDDQQARTALYTCVARGDTPRSFEIAHEVHMLYKHLREFEAEIDSKCFYITQDGHDWSLRRFVSHEEVLYELDNIEGVQPCKI